MSLLQVRDLSVQFPTSDGLVTAVEGVSFDVASGSTVGIVGESGSGKSVTSLAIMGLIAAPPARVSGQIMFEGQDLRQASPDKVRDLRGRDIAMVFQEPMSALNPVFPIGFQISEGLARHRGMSRSAAHARAIELLDMVRMPDARKRANDYPHEMSGGMLQRSMIAMAIACSPKLLIADEPTTALDVTIQAQILQLLRDLQRDLGMSLVFITHDLGVIAEMCDEVCVMYAGRVVERTDVGSLFTSPQHPYTQGLLQSVPKLYARASRLRTMEGAVPSVYNMPTGCSFHPRCPHVETICQNRRPALFELDDEHRAACWIHRNFGADAPLATSRG